MRESLRLRDDPELSGRSTTSNPTHTIRRPRLQGTEVCDHAVLFQQHEAFEARQTLVSPGPLRFNFDLSGTARPTSEITDLTASSQEVDESQALRRLVIRDGVEELELESELGSEEGTLDVDYMIELEYSQWEDMWEALRVEREESIASAQQSY